MLFRGIVVQGLESHNGTARLDWLDDFICKITLQDETHVVTGDLHGAAQRALSIPRDAIGFIEDDDLERYIQELLHRCEDLDLGPDHVNATFIARVQFQDRVWTRLTFQDIPRERESSRGFSSARRPGK